MLHVFICEDISTHKNQIHKIIQNCITIENLDMEVKVSTDNPNDIIQFLEKDESTGLYFLDVDLKCDMTGIELAEVIREYDPRGFIVFITAHPDVLHITFELKVEAMDFIIKDPFVNLSTRIRDCILNAHKKYTAKICVLQRNFTFKLYDQLITVACDDILYFTVSNENEHKIILYTLNERFEFYGFLKDIEGRLDKKFFRCHRKCIVNLSQVKVVDLSRRKLVFKNNTLCPVAKKNLKVIEKIIFGLK